MANTIDWGEASVNNTNGYGKGAIDNTIRWGKIYESSASGETNIGTASTPSYSNTKSVRFDGVDDFCVTASTYSALDGATKASFSMWLNPTSSSTTQRTVFQIGDGSSSGVNGVCQLFIREGNRIDFSVDSGSFFGRANISAITYGSWNHLLISVDFDRNPEFKCYVNGVDETTSDNMFSRTAFATATEGLYIGEWATSDKDPFFGAIDEFAIWSGTALTSIDATAIYNSGAPNDLNNNGLTAPTTYYRMGDGDTFPTLQDTNGSAGLTMVNMTSGNIITDVPT